MKAKRIIVNVGVILIALFIFTSWYGARLKNENRAASALTRRYNIYLITTDKEYQYWNFVNQGAEDMAGAIGINYVWEAPERRNVMEQIAIINQAVEAGANALLVAADDPKNISGVIEDAKARGVKIIYVDSPAYEEAITTLATNNYEAGVIAGNAMLSKLEERGINSGYIGIVSVTDKANSDLREMGFRDALGEDGRYTILQTVFTGGDPLEAQVEAERLIEHNNDLVGLFGTNEGASEGVGYAIGEADREIIGIGFDRTDAMLELLQEGNLKAIIAQNPYTMGYLGMAEAVAALLGRSTGPSYIDTGVSVLEYTGE